MSGRGHPTALGMMRHGQPPGVGAQFNEIDHLVMENKKLAASIAAMRQDRAMTNEDICRTRAHIRSIETESDIQIRILLEKISRMELDLKAGESVKKDLQQAHKDAQSLLVAIQELKLKVQQNSRELDKWHADIKRIPDMLSKLDSMKLEHQHLRSAFEREKCMNLELVKHMQKKEKTLVNMDREVEILRAEILAVENRVHAPYGGSLPNQDVQYTSPYQSNDPYYDPYRRVAMEGMVPHSNSDVPSPAVGTNSIPPRHLVGAYDPVIAPK